MEMANARAPVDTPIRIAIRNPVDSHSESCICDMLREFGVVSYLAWS